MKMGLPFITAHLVAAIAGVLVRPAGGGVGHALKLRTSARARWKTSALVPERKTLRQLRHEQGWTQEQLARRLGVQQATVSQWEHGSWAPRPATQQHLADLVGVKVAEIAVGHAEEPGMSRPASQPQTTKRRSQR